MTTDLEAIQRFVNAAQDGHHPAASTGEKIAARLAKALHGIGDDFAVIDRQLIAGAFGLAQLMGGPWPTETDKQTVFRLARRAANARR